MKKYLPWLILASPILVYFLLWDYLPERMPVHASDRGVDRYGSREDFAGLVLTVTMIFGIMFFIATKAISSFSPMTRKELDEAYLGGAIGAAVIGYIWIYNDCNWLGGGSLIQPAFRSNKL